jgi:hypothetical protein
VARKKNGIPGLFFSLRRASGLSAAKGKISRKIGVPLTRSGRQRKAGRSIGCVVPIFLFLSFSTAALLWVSKAFALDLPTYDVERVCRNFADRQTGFVQQDQFYKLCIRDEQSSYDLLKIIWDELSAATQNRCGGYLGTGNGAYRGYSRLESCGVFMLGHDRLEKQSPKFHY